VGNWAGENGILGLLDLPHFGRGQNTTTCVKQLLAVTHGGDIWLDKPIPITVELIAQITGLPIQGMDPTLFLDEKTKEKALAEEMKKKYGTSKGDKRHHHQTNQQRIHTVGHKNLILQVAKKMSQRGSTSWSCCSCIPVRRRHLNELGTILIELIPRGLQGCARI
jgi:hypothetical protein